MRDFSHGYHSYPRMMHPVETTLATVMGSFSNTLPKTTFDTNWIVPSAESSDWAAKEKDEKLKIFPRMNRPVPRSQACQEMKSS
jgi:hypothetical protein